MILLLLVAAACLMPGGAIAADNAPGVTVLRGGSAPAPTAPTGEGKTETPSTTGSRDTVVVPRPPPPHRPPPPLVPR
ncbi:MAG: hypothetical protein KIT25_05295 [Enhydrobacter sp.]|nr:MAG: hypothetical protein KIT25_05295 [Enhydrobacter sp.]